MAQYYCKVEPLFIVKPGSFNPPPKVDSAIVRLRPYDELPHPAKDVKMFERVVREAFNMRRKTIRNTLKNLATAEQLEGIGIDTGLRPENISLPDYVKIANYLTDLEKRSEERRVGKECRSRWTT